MGAGPAEASNQVN